MEFVCHEKQSFEYSFMTAVFRWEELRPEKVDVEIYFKDFKAHDWNVIGVTLVHRCFWIVEYRTTRDQGVCIRCWWQCTNNMTPICFYNIRCVFVITCFAFSFHIYFVTVFHFFQVVVPSAEVWTRLFIHATCSVTPVSSGPEHPSSALGSTASSSKGTPSCLGKVFLLVWLKRFEEKLKDRLVQK